MKGISALEVISFSPEPCGLVQPTLRYDTFRQTLS